MSKLTTVLLFLATAWQIFANGDDYLRVMKELEDVTRAEEGAEPVDYTILLRCNISGLPIPSFTWTKNGSPLNLTQRYRLTRTFRGSTLRIVKLVPEDSGLYECRAVNRHGQVTTTSNVTVTKAAPIRYASVTRHACHETTLRRMQDVVPHHCQRACDARPDCKSFYTVKTASRMCGLSSCGRSELKSYWSDDFTYYVKPDNAA